MKVKSFIDHNYSYDKLQRIFISGDGASWIKAGATYLEKALFCADKYHLMKYINIAAAQMLDELYKFVRFYKEFPEILDSVRPKSLPLLSWTHYRILLQVSDKEARDWYEKEAIPSFLQAICSPFQKKRVYTISGQPLISP